MQDSAIVGILVAGAGFLCVLIYAVRGVVFHAVVCRDEAKYNAYVRRDGFTRFVTRYLDLDRLVAWTGVTLLVTGSLGAIVGSLLGK